MRGRDDELPAFCVNKLMRGIFFLFAILLAMMSFFLPTITFSTTLYTFAQGAEPKYIVENGKMTGICNDIIDALNEELKGKGISISYKSNELKNDAEIFNSLKSGEIQVFVGFGVNNERYRELKYIFMPLYSIKESVLVRKGESKAVMAKNSVTIGTIRASLSSDDVNQVFKKNTTKEFKNIAEAIEVLDAKKIDAIFYPSISVGFYTLKFPEKYEMLNIETKKYYHYIVFNKNVSDKDVHAVEQALRFMFAQRLIDKIISKYKMQSYMLSGDILEFVTIEWPPYEFSQSGKIVGSDVEVIAEVFKKLGYRTLFYIELPSRAIQRMKSEIYDGVFSVWKGDERDNFLLYPDEPISYTKEVMWYVKSNSKNLQDTLNSTNTICGYVNGYAYDDKFWQIKCTKIPLESDEVGFNLLRAGRINTFATAYETGKFVAKELGMLNEVSFAYISEQKRPQYLAFGNSIYTSYLAHVFTQELVKFKLTEGYGNILSKYGIER